MARVQHCPQALKKQIATFVNIIYLKAHKDHNVSYEIVSIAVLLAVIPLFNEYCDITPIDQQATAKRLGKAWDPSNQSRLSTAASRTSKHTPKPAT
jgi:hypothetical protein